jgi:hypothetical protein
MTDAVSAVKLIRSCGLNHRQFKVFLEETVSEYGQSLYCCEIHWISKGKVLQGFLSLLEETSFPYWKTTISQAF